jgi:FHA domain
MALCPSGHESQTTDYCDTCGAVMGGAPAAAALGVPAGRSVPGAGRAGADGACPQCGAARDGRFCEECGYDFELAALLPPGSAAPSSASYSVPTVAIETAEAGGQFDPSDTAAIDPREMQLLLAQAEADEDDGDFAIPGWSQQAALMNQQSGTPTGFGTPPIPPTVPLPEPEAESQSQQQPQSQQPQAQSTAAAAGQSASSARSGSQASQTPAQEAAATSSSSSVSRPARPVGPPLVAIVVADYEYYRMQVERGDIVEADFPFPKYAGERRFELSGDLLRIGRASSSRGIVVEIDLTGPPLDPAVSHLHAQLIRRADGSWALVDLNSANGTRVNGGQDPIPAETEIPIAVGDRIQLGGWTTITVHKV